MLDKIADSYPTQIHNSRPINSSWGQALPAEEHAIPFPHLPVDKLLSLNETHVLCGHAHDQTEVTADGASSQLLYLFVQSGVLESHNTKTRLSTTIREGQAGVVTNHPAIALKLGRDCQWLAFQIPLSLLRSQFGLWSRRFCFQEPRFSVVSDFCEHPVSGLYHTLQHLLARGGEGRKPLLDASYEQLLITQLYATAPHSFTGSSHMVQQPYPRQLRTAEDFMRDNLCTAITVDDIARAAGCSTRTLQRIFRHFRDATPIQILCRHRIAEAHELIVSGRARTVTDVAANLQFSNPARFAVIYREAYGQRPSTVLRFHSLQRGGAGTLPDPSHLPTTN